MEQTYHVITRHIKYVDIQSSLIYKTYTNWGVADVAMPNYKQKVSHNSMRPNRLVLAWSRGRHVLHDSMLAIPEGEGRSIYIGNNPLQRVQLFQSLKGCTRIFTRTFEAKSS